jgi:meiotically up-regulated gene 157 (Mug157) protein
MLLLLYDNETYIFDKNNSDDADQLVPRMTARLFEGKYQIESLCVFFKLSYWHWRYSGDEALLRYADSAWITAVSRLLDIGKLCQDDVRPLTPSVRMMHWESW